MSKGVIAPLALTGIVVGVAQGWLGSAWTAIYNITHSGNPVSNPATSGIGGGQSGGLFNPIAGNAHGADAATGGFSGEPGVTIAGTLTGGKFTPNNKIIPSFQIQSAPNEIPSSILTLIYKAFKPGSGGLIIIQ